MRILNVRTVKLTLMKSNPPQLLIEADGNVTTSGWKNIELVPMEEELSKDGILDLEFVGTPPTGLVNQVIRPVSADHTVAEDVDKIVGVQVHARTNSITQLVNRQPTEQAPVAPDTAFKTMAIGEEKIPFGEKSSAFGEEKIPFGEKSPAFGEEKIPFGEKSPIFGEETLPIGETRPDFGAETLAIGIGGETHPGIETGPGLGFETQAIGRGESGPLTIETDPGIENGGTFFGENTVAGEDFNEVFTNRIRTPFNQR